MEESGSVGLDEELFRRKNTFLQVIEIIIFEYNVGFFPNMYFSKDVDYVCISDNYWLGKNKPCLTYGLR
jgi:nonspecific dipeptidase